MQKWFKLAKTFVENYISMLLLTTKLYNYKSIYTTFCEQIKIDKWQHLAYFFSTPSFHHLHHYEPDSDKVLSNYCRLLNFHRIFFIFWIKKFVLPSWFPFVFKIDSHLIEKEKQLFKKSTCWKVTVLKTFQHQFSKRNIS